MGIQSGLTAFLFAAGAIVLAEMGDKTQLIAMAFASKYKAIKVLIGIFIASALNHGLAVWIGHLITHIESVQGWIKAGAALLFIFFGLWTVHGDKPGEEKSSRSRFGAVATVAIAFFFAEMGDKTQLAAVALATEFPADPLAVLAGTITGMLAANGAGIIIGTALCKKVPERIIKLVSAGAFIVFGLIESYEVAKKNFGFTTGDSLLITSGLAVLTLAAVYFLVKSNKEREIFVMKGTAGMKGVR